METSADQVRIEFQKWALSTNETAAEAKKEAAKKAEEPVELLRQILAALKK